jgi:hypothetical protein
MTQVLADLVNQLASGSSGDAGTQLASQLSQLSTATQTQSDTFMQNMQVLEQNTNTASGGSSAGAAAQTASGILRIGSALSPLITGLIGLFGGGSSSASVPLTTYTAPPSINFAASYGDAASGTSSGASQSSGTGQPLTIQVQAIDSQSFLDHSDEIAQAVRQAMLNSNGLNDVVSDL